MSPRRKQEDVVESESSESESAKQKRTTRNGVVSIVKGNAELAHFTLKGIKADRDLRSMLESFAAMLQEMGTDAKVPSSITTEPPFIALTPDVRLYFSVIASDKVQCPHCGCIRKHGDLETKMDWCDVCQGKFDDDIEFNLDI